MFRRRCWSPRMPPHVDSTTMLIAQLHGAEIGGPRFNVQCQAAQPGLELAGWQAACWVMGGRGGAVKGPPWTCMWLLVCASAACLRSNNGSDGTVNWVNWRAGQASPRATAEVTDGWVGPAVHAPNLPCRRAG